MLRPMDPAEELRYLVLAAQRDGNRALAALLRPAGLTPAQAEVIGVLDRAGAPLTVAQVGEVLVCEPGSPSRLVSSLVTAGLVEREPHPEDGRASALELTAAGREAAARVRAVDAQFHAELAARLPGAEEVEAALRVLRGLAGEGAAATAARRRAAARTTTAQ